MKITKILTAIVMILIAGHYNLSKAEPMGTVFTYEGYFWDADEPAEGLYDLQFILYDDPDPNFAEQIGCINEVNDLYVTEGCYIVDLDFSLDDAEIFDGQACWLEVSFRAGELNDPEEYTILGSRQEILPVPYALYARTTGGISMTEGAVEGYVLTSDANGLASWKTPPSETDPVFSSSKAAEITRALFDAWTRAYGWGDHSKAGYLTSETDPTVDASIKDGVSWGEVSAIPAGFADGTDDIGLTSETDPTVLASVKDGVSWSEVSAIPAGFADGVDNVGTGDITGVTAGTGLSGGGASGNVTLNINVPLELSGNSNSPTIRANNTSDGYGVYGYSNNNAGVFGQSDSSVGLSGSSNNSYGVYGQSTTSYGVVGYSSGSIGVSGISYNSYGVVGQSNSGVGLSGSSNSNYGVYGQSTSSYGVYGYSESKYGVYGYSTNGHGVHGRSRDSYGVYGSSVNSYAGAFVGNVIINGTLSKSGGSFKIDHPLDPENKYLQHSFVESPDMMNIYNGNVILDEEGMAVVELPDYFEALNFEFRYQLTAIGAPGPNLYIAEEISGNTFKIAGGTADMKVSWQVTGIRQDAYALENRIEVEVDKPDEERGYYLHPEAYGLPKEQGVEKLHNPEIMEQAKERESIVSQNIN